jgi:hypothetical protein
MKTIYHILYPIVFLLLLSIHSINAEPPKYYPRKEDVKFIKCEVCRYLALNAFEQGQDLVAAKQASDDKVTEDEFIELMEKVTTAWRPEGEWITALHLTKSLTGGSLSVKNMNRQGECREACKTIERAAQEVMGEHDTDVAEALFVVRLELMKLRRRKLENCFVKCSVARSLAPQLTPFLSLQKKHDSRKAFSTWLCDDLTDACSSTSSIPSLPSGHKAYPKFLAMAPDAQNIDRVMGQMADSGLKGQMYSREELMEKYMDELGTDPSSLGGKDEL